MSDLLERTSYITDRPDTGPPAPVQPPPIEMAPLPWPRLAKVLVAILAVTTLAGVFGTIVAYNLGDNDTVSQEQFDDLTTERDSLLTEQQQLTGQLATETARVDDLTTERDSLLTQQQQLTEQLATETARVDDLTTELAQVNAALASETADVETLTAQRDQLQASIAASTETIVELRAELATSVEQAAALAGMFPLVVSTDLTVGDMIGTWNVDWQRAYCEGFATCTSNPGFTALKITETAQGNAQLAVDGQFVAGLGQADGAYVAIAQSMSAVPACDGVARVANVGVVIYGNGATAASDGTIDVSGLGMVVVVDAAATGTCPAGIAAFGATLAAS